jgi:hypothetical protein
MSIEYTCSRFMLRGVSYEIETRRREDGKLGIKVWKMTPPGENRKGPIERLEIVGKEQARYIWDHYKRLLVRAGGWEALRQKAKHA